MVTVSRRRRKGQATLSLLEIAIALAVLALSLAMGFGVSTSRRPGGLQASSHTFAAMLDHTRELAQTSGNGATLELGPIGAAQISMQVFSGRPNSIGMASNPSATEKLNIAASTNLTGGGGIGFGQGGGGNGCNLCSIGIYVNSNGGASWSVWPTVTPMASEPPCAEASPLVITFNNSGQTSSTQVNCDDARSTNP